MGHRLGVVPDVGAGAVAAAGVVAAAFPRPESAVGLAQNGGRLEDREVRRDRFEHFRRQRAVIEAIAEVFGFLAQAGEVVAPVGGELGDIAEAAGVPRLVLSGHGLVGRFGVFAEAEVGFAHIPCEAKQNGFFTAGGNLEGHEEACAGGGVAFGEGCRSHTAAPLAISFHAIVRGSHQPPRNQAWFTFRPGSPVVARMLPCSQPFSLGAELQSMKPSGMLRTARAFCPTAMKFLALNEKTASSGWLVVLMKRYSRAATGRLESSASPGSKGLQPVISTCKGTDLSSRLTVANGKRVEKRAWRKRGRPKEAPAAPLPVPGEPKSFQPGTGPSRTRATLFLPSTQTAAKVQGSLNTSGLLRREK